MMYDTHGKLSEVAEMARTYIKGMIDSPLNTPRGMPVTNHIPCSMDHPLLQRIPQPIVYSGCRRRCSKCAWVGTLAFDD
jgi:hypothetical protein